MFDSIEFDPFSGLRLSKSKSCRRSHALRKKDLIIYLMRPRSNQGLEYLLTHFEEPLWPRTISTKTTEGIQIVVFILMEAFARFRQANGLDCRINALIPKNFSFNWLMKLLENLQI